MSVMPTIAPAARPALLATDLLDLVERSRGALVDACAASTTSERYVNGHLAALRAAAALLSQVAPRAVGARPRSAWDALAEHVPELTEWALFFSACARRSRAAQAGIVVVSMREADDLVRQGEAFLDIVLAQVGLPPGPSVVGHLTPASVG